MPSTKPSISVLIPTHDRLVFTLESIRSVLGQTYQHFEIIVIDDGSQFDLYHWLCYFFSLELKSEKIRYLFQQNQGVSSARNAGIREARHDWIALLDSDDLWLPKKLERQVEEIRQEGVRVIHSDEKWVRNGKRVKQRKSHAKPSGEVFSECLEFCRVSPSSILLHKEVFETCGYFNEALPVCEDYDLWLRLALKYAFHLIPEPLVIKQGGHKDQLSYSEWGLDRFRIQSLKNLLKNEELKEWQRSRVVSILRKKLTYVINGAEKRGNTETAMKYRKVCEELGI